MDWDPGQYQRYADERGRPFADLTARVSASRPAYVVDLGCGPGTLTATLAHRWPAAVVEGVDSSPAMVAEARRSARSDRLRFTTADLVTWQPPRPVDVLVSNATLQWVPDHRTVIRRLVALVAPGGWFAFQVPRNFDEASHRLLRELAEQPAYAPHLDVGKVFRSGASAAATYLADLAGFRDRVAAVDAWETTYLHVLDGEDPVWEWMAGTGARPLLQALPDELRPGFEREYRQALRAAYPRQAHGTVLPFRRVFVVARTVEAADRPEGAR